MKCDKCPVVGRCIAEDPLHAYACGFATSGIASERRWLEDASALVAGRPAPEPRSEKPRTRPKSKPRPKPKPAPESRALPADFGTRLVEVQACRSRTDGPACGCAAKMRCLKYARDVTLDECLACVASGRADPPETAGDPGP